MIPGIKPRKHITKSLDGLITFIVHIPDTPGTIEEAEEVCKHLRRIGYYCGIIYKYVHNLNGKVYIGQTIRPKQRHNNHLYDINCSKQNTAWHNALKKYGPNSFRYQILEVLYDKDEKCLHELLNEREKYHIAFEHTTTGDGGYGYNIATGGTGFQSKSKTEKAVDMFDMDGNFICTFRSLSEASRQFGFSGSTIRQVCNHAHYSAGGHLWAWHGEKPRLAPDDRVYAYDSNGTFVAEYANQFVASKTLGQQNGNICSALKDKYRLAYDMYWRTYKAEQIPLSDFPKAIYAYDTTGNYVKGFINLAKAKDFIGDSASSGISHAIIRKTAHKGYLWRKEYTEHIDPSDGRFINKAAVIAIFPDGSKKKYEMIKDAATEIGMHTSGIHRSIKLGVKTVKGIKFIRANE